MVTSCRMWTAAVCCVLLVVRLTEAGKPDSPGKNGNGVNTFLTDLQSALDMTQTNVARLEGCGVDKVGAECEKVTSDDDGPAQPDGKRIQQSLIPKNERAAVASSGRIVNTDAEQQQQQQQVQLVQQKKVYLLPNFNAPSSKATKAKEAASYGLGDSVIGRSGGRGSRPVRSKKGPCLTRNGMFPHKNPARYYKCNGGRYVMKRCDKGLTFDAKLKYCTAADTAPGGGVITRSVKPPTYSVTSGNGKTVIAPPVPVKTTVLERKTVIDALRPGAKEILGIQQLATVSRKQGVFCSSEPTGRRRWRSRHATVEQCWNAALRRNAAFLLISASGCQFRRDVSRLRSSVCSTTAYHVIDISFFRSDLARLRPDMQYWISARSPSDVVWGTVSNIPDKPLNIRGCGELCYKFGQDFARVDYRGCRCGMAGRETVTIRQEDLKFLRRQKAALDPGFTVQLHSSGQVAWQCTAAPLHFVRITAAQTLQEALIACRERRFKFLTPGKDGFYCGNSTDNLERFSRTQCQMNVTTTRAYSVISIQAIERQIVAVENSLYDYVFWWVSTRPPGVFWSSLLGVTQLEQCVLTCNRRFVAVGPDGCFCGSLRKGVPSLHVHEWALKGEQSTGNPSQGYLMLDKRGFVNVPEGWHCTSEPIHWRIYKRKVLFNRCMLLCEKDKKAYAAFGRRGCLCGDKQDTKLRRLPMASCQDARKGPGAYSVLSVDIWRRNVDIASRNPEHKQVCWVDRKPSGVPWEAQPGANVLEQCINTCTDQQGVSLIVLGVNGCECGFGSPSVKTASLCNPLVRSARVFLLIQRNGPSKGYTPPKFDWIVKANLTKTDHKIDVSVEPWIKVSVTNTSQTRSKTIRGGFFVSTRSENQVRNKSSDATSVSAGKNNITTDVKHVETIATITNNVTTNGTTKVGQIGEVKGQSQKLIQKESLKKEEKNSEEHNIRAGQNDISIKSVKDSNLTIDREIADKISTDGYKKHFVKGHRTTQTSERFTNDADENLVRATRVTSDMIQKDLLLNQTHGDSTSMDVRINRENVKRNKAKERSEGSTVILQIHIEGKCYVGPANWTEWADNSTRPGSPFKCLCFCLMEKKLFYAIYDNNNCFCAAKHGLFGTDTGITTTNGECPKAGRVVYDGLQHTQELSRFCRGRKQTSILQFLQKTENKGHKVVDFKNSELSEAKINSSSLQGTHLNRTDAAVAKTVRRWHEKEGVIVSRWNSRLTKGPLRNLYGLRLHVQRRQEYKERMNLTTHEHVQTTQSERGVPFRSGDGYTLTASRSSQSSVVRPEASGPVRLLSHGSDGTTITTDTPTGRITSTTTQVTSDGRRSSVLASARKAGVAPAAAVADTVQQGPLSLLQSVG